MQRLIDADALLKKCIEGDGNDKFTEGYNFAVQEISAYITLAPTIEPEVRHGRWVVHTTWHGMFGLIHSECSECKFDRNGDLSSWKFCPNCGAKMDGGAENDDCKEV